MQNDTVVFMVCFCFSFEHVSAYILRVWNCILDSSQTTVSIPVVCAQEGRGLHPSQTEPAKLSSRLPS